ncbi:membrane dipeptidase [Candidatus Bathyarchaeota archaeon]|nr:membrane dipeptidase [Candidatus Bathyarchaeota archaeon]MBL7079518.1 membrane dipeptidase [Candidatus Bathyarchaeota archaeon]
MVSISDFELTRDEESHALRLHEEAVVIDALQGVLAADPDRYFPEFVEGGVTACFQDVGGGGDSSPYPEVSPLNFREAVLALDGLKRIVEAHGDKFVFAEYAEDVRRAKGEGRIALIPQMQACAAPIESNFALLRALHGLGLKVIQLTYNSQTSVGSGCCEPIDSGLSLFGRGVVKEMNRIGAVVDVSHGSDGTMNDAIEHSRGPVIVSHSSCRALSPSPRNCTDETIVALAEKGGVIGICAWSPLLSLDQSKVRSTLGMFLDHVDHAVGLVGVDHVGVSTDINWKGLDEGWCSKTMMYWRRDRPDVYGYDRPLDLYPPPPVGLERVSAFPNITRGLVARGYSDGEILKIWGGNWLRVFEEVWGR